MFKSAHIIGPLLLQFLLSLVLNTAAVRICDCLNCLSTGTFLLKEKPHNELRPSALQTPRSVTD